MEVYYIKSQNLKNGGRMEMSSQKKKKKSNKKNYNVTFLPPLLAFSF